MAEKNDQCLLMSHNRTTTYDTDKDNISNETHQFRIGELPGDKQCLFASSVYSFDRPETINIKSLRKKVADFIRKSKDIDDIRLISTSNCCTREEYCSKIEQGIIWSSEQERLALAHLYPNILFCIISKVNNKHNKFSIEIDKYVINELSYTKCIIIVYNEEFNQYMPLYLYDKINHKEENFNFKYNDAIMELLGYFIRKTFNYDGYINFENGGTDHEVDSSVHVESVFNDIFDKIAVKRHKKQGNLIPSKTTEEFVQKYMDEDGDCLYSSFCYLFSLLEEITVQALRDAVANSVLQSNDIDDEVLFTETHKKREEYCDTIKNTNAFGGEMEIRAVAKLFRIIVRVINVIKVNSAVSAVHVTEYPEDEPSFKRCVYIIHLQNNHYEPLFLRDTNNLNYRTKDFDRNNSTVKEQLCKFIRDELHYRGLIEFDTKPGGNEFNLKPHQTNNFMNESNLIVNNVQETSSKKRKMPEDDEPTFMVNKNSSTSSTLYIDADNNQSSRCSRPIPSNDQIYTCHNGNYEPGSIEEHLNTDIFSNLNSSVVQSPEQGRVEASSSLFSSHTAVSHNAPNQQIKLEIEPIQEFRGRFLSDIVPKKETKKNGTKAAVKKPPTYFSDRHNQHYLNLLIPERFLPSDLYLICFEIAIITTNITGCIYFHPYFKFYDARYGNTPPTSNPLYINLGSDKNYELKNYSEGIKSMLLYLPLIILTNNELLLNQPMQPFQSLNPNGQPYTGTYDKYDAFKADFHLNDLHFAITPCIRDRRDTEYRRLIDLQYISEVSKQNKDFKVTETSNS